MVQILLNAKNTKANPNLGDNNKCTPLHFAVVDKENLEVVDLLLKTNADPNFCDKDRATPLHWAARRSKSQEVMKKLLDAGADPNFCDKDGKTSFDFVEKNPDLQGTRVYWTLNNRKWQNIF